MSKFDNYASEFPTWSELREKTLSIDKAPEGCDYFYLADGRPMKLREETLIIRPVVEAVMVCREGTKHLRLLRHGLSTTRCCCGVPADQGNWLPTSSIVPTNLFMSACLSTSLSLSSYRSVYMPIA
eukprot:GHVU01037081.1.p1 GENE.GHVU01037081.1~~GHVU01037081.1.p1  ORF type:complete len:126 (+),score=2.02 GHVU01037081.1:376-753(+)